MSATAQAERQDEPTQLPVNWIEAIEVGLSRTNRRADMALRTNLSAARVGGKLTYFLPPEMALIQPQALRFMRALARSEHCRLIEDRRSLDLKPIIEQRQRKPTPLALGTALLLKQAGLRGKAPQRSSPHRMRPEYPWLALPQLLALAPYVVEHGKRIVTLPNRLLLSVFGGSTRPLCGHGARLSRGAVELQLGLFEGEHYRALAYRSQDQFAVHVLLGGGPLDAPQMWCHPDMLMNSPLRLQLFKGQGENARDYGLLYTSHYMDIDISA